jgi:5-methylcytosine-specific restriction endonuclease McrA
MAYLKKPCAFSFCGNLAVPGTRYCEKHAKTKEEERRERDRLYKTMRQDKDIQALYKSHKWRLLRDEKLKANPECELCGKKAVDVHHRVPVKAGGKFFDIDNLISLCRGCHNEIHSKNNFRR